MNDTSCANKMNNLFDVLAQEMARELQRRTGIPLGSFPCEIVNARGAITHATSPAGHHPIIILYDHGMRFISGWVFADLRYEDPGLLDQLTELLKQSEAKIDAIAHEFAEELRMRLRTELE